MKWRNVIYITKFSHLKKRDLKAKNHQDKASKPHPEAI
ncbi:hypothetical protein yaldo0001_5300 [Yersinia aldovae ATCC 35236]|uniref:Uncharacterized protein n=1 Tax=Yersinia aldovae TaxID=29483 RepID=A0A0T9TUA2_YERAL|nr:hypothetical protein AT01_1727 [Yersinia aldovae 670-83]EEP95015.1 hypothetical protein yaldo0001_5300 [Yersinia aldovae ATCC 35236]CNK11864.1 Uncharacterised protein [Yersinia aldovae]CNL02384.1 Uncharacterised protein [Yersinia aldovae]CNL24482.1 Uncharacterised protein [Yersinia aldovae]